MAEFIEKRIKQLSPLCHLFSLSVSSTWLIPNLPESPLTRVTSQWLQSTNSFQFLLYWVLSVIWHPWQLPPQNPLLPLLPSLVSFSLSDNSPLPLCGLYSLSLTLCTCGCFPGLSFSSLLVLCPLLGRAQLRPTSSDDSYFTPLQEFQMEIPS